jgi:hypothetical protein
VVASGIALVPVVWVFSVGAPHVSPVRHAPREEARYNRARSGVNRR